MGEVLTDHHWVILKGSATNLAAVHIMHTKFGQAGAYLTIRLLLTATTVPFCILLRVSNLRFVPLRTNFFTLSGSGYSYIILIGLTHMHPIARILVFASSIIV